MQVASGEAAQAQEYLIAHGKRMSRMAGILEERKRRQRARGGAATTFNCEWVFGREISV